MSDTPVYRPGAAKRERRKECVPIADGEFHVWVWSLTLADSTQIIERSARPEIDKRGGHNQSMAIAMQIQLSCYDSDKEDASRIWEDNTRGDIYTLSMADMTALLAAINRVNGQDATEQEILRDFTRVGQESST